MANDKLQPQLSYIDNRTHVPKGPPLAQLSQPRVHQLSFIWPWQRVLQAITPVANATLVGITRILIDQAVLGTTTIIDDPTAGDIFFPSQQIYDAANETIMDFWAAAGRQDVPISLATAATPLAVTTATDIYSFDTTTIMIPTYITLNTMLGSGAGGELINQRYFITDRSKLEQYARDWRNNQQAQPKWFVLWDAFHLRVFPQPDQNYTFTIWGLPWGTEIATGTEDIAVDQVLRLAMAYKTAATILEATRPEVSDLYTQNAEQCLNRYCMRLRNQQTNNIRRMKPGVNGRMTDDTMAAYKGVIKVGNRLS